MSLAIIGDFLTEEDKQTGKYFTGAAGSFFRQVMRHVGLPEQQTYFDSVIHEYPRGADIKAFCGAKTDSFPGAFNTAKLYLRLEYLSFVKSLQDKLLANPHNLIVTAGSLATWALTGNSSIKQQRGTTIETKYGKVLCTYSPYTIFRDYTLLPILQADLKKAVREMQFPEIRRPSRIIHYAPTLAELEEIQITLLAYPRWSIDIETKSDQITCIGIAPNPHLAYVIPFWLKNGDSYWSAEEEPIVWQWLKKLLSCCQEAVFQNGLYDMRFLWRQYGIPIPGATHDTMLLHHALQPEVEKGLGFLGSIYTDEASWKFMRDNETIKQED